MQFSAVSTAHFKHSRKIIISEKIWTRIHLTVVVNVMRDSLCLIVWASSSLKWAISSSRSRHCCSSLISDSIFSRSSRFIFWTIYNVEMRKLEQKIILSYVTMWAWFQSYTYNSSQHKYHILRVKSSVHSGTFYRRLWVGFPSGIYRTNRNRTNVCQ